MHRLSCEETFRRLDDYLDRELSEGELRLVRAHLEECAACGTEFRFEAEVLDAVRRKLRRISAPADLIQRISASIQRAIDQERPRPPAGPPA